MLVFNLGGAAPEQKQRFSDFKFVRKYFLFIFNDAIVYSICSADFSQRIPELSSGA